MTCIQNIKEFLKVNHKKTIQLKKWMKDINRCFTKEDVQMANKCMTRCSTSFVTGGFLIKTRYHYTPIGMAKIQETENIKY